MRQLERLGPVLTNTPGRSIEDLDVSCNRMGPGALGRARGASGSNHHSGSLLRALDAGAAVAGARPPAPAISAMLTSFSALSALELWHAELDEQGCEALASFLARQAARGGPLTHLSFDVDCVQVCAYMCARVHMLFTLEHAFLLHLTTPRRRAREDRVY
jgi:hypothetical protein